MLLVPAVEGSGDRQRLGRSRGDVGDRDGLDVVRSGSLGFRGPSDWLAGREIGPATSWAG